MDKHHECGLESDLMIEIMDLRKERGITQLAIARRIGCTDAAISNWESGIAYPLTFSRWLKLASAVGAKLTISLEV